MCVCLHTSVSNCMGIFCLVSVMVSFFCIFSCLHVSCARSMLMSPAPVLHVTFLLLLSLSYCVYACLYCLHLFTHTPSLFYLPLPPPLSLSPSFSFPPPSLSPSLPLPSSPSICLFYLTFLNTHTHTHTHTHSSSHYMHL